MMPAFEESQRVKPIAILVTVVFILVFSIILSGHIQKVGDVLRSSGWSGVVLSIGLYGILGASPIPSEPYTVLIATIYGPWTATAIATFGNYLAALVEYSIGVHLGAAAENRFPMSNLPFGLHRLPFDSPLFLIAGRMLPPVGPKGASILCGALRVSLWRYSWTTLVSTFIGALVFSFGGHGLQILSASG